jgi:rod shape-determining protein MreC
MAIYTVGRRRVIIALLLTGALLLTLDLRGNAVLDTIRDGFSRAMAPVEQAADVVTTPVKRAWNSYSSYDELEEENLALRDEIERQRGTQAAAEASIIDYQLLLALNNLPSLSGIETEKAQIVGGATNNIDQVVEINKGTDDGIAVGMPVVNQAGLIGKITLANAKTSTVMLVTDQRYSIPVEILAGTGEAGDEETTDTTPSGLSDDEVDDVVAEAEAEQAEAEQAEAEAEVEATESGTVPNGTTPDEVFADEVDLPQGAPPTSAPTTTEPESDTSEDDEPTSSSSSTTTTTTTVPEPEQLEKEFGVLQGRGQGRPPQVRFLQDIPSIATLQVGDLIETAGGAESLAPPNIPVGRVINRADRPGVAGPLLEVELLADLDRLNFVRVVLYQPLIEVPEADLAETDVSE